MKFAVAAVRALSSNVEALPTSYDLPIVAASCLEKVFF